MEKRNLTEKNIKNAFERKNKNGSFRKWHCLLFSVAGLFAILQGKAALADSIERNMTYSQTPWAPWIEMVFIAMVGLMVVLAVVTIVYLHHQKEREKMQQEIQRSKSEETQPTEREEIQQSESEKTQLTESGRIGKKKYK